MTTPSTAAFDGCGAGSSEPQATRPAFLAVYLLLGIAFGFVLSRSEVISWFRIQEMFRFQSFRMYGIIGSAVVTAAVSVALIKRSEIKSVAGERISIPAKELRSGIRYAAGGTIFGLGWQRLNNIVPLVRFFNQIFHLSHGKATLNNDPGHFFLNRDAFQT